MSDLLPPTSMNPDSDDPQGPGSLLGPESENYADMRRRRSVGRWAGIAWVFVAIPAMLIIVSNVAAGRAARAQGPVEPVAGDQVAIELTARAFVGINDWAQRAGASSPELTRPLEPAARENIDPKTTPPGDLVRFATLAGELNGPDAALDILNAAEAMFEGPSKAALAREHLAGVFGAQENLATGHTAPSGAMDDLNRHREALRTLHTTAPPDGESPDDSAYAEGMRRDITMLRRIYQDGGPGDVPADEQARLRLRHGFFGHLALAHEQAAGNTDRDVVSAKARQTFLTLFAAVAVVVTAFLTGFVLFIVAIVLLVKKRVKLRLAWQIRELRLHHHVFVETMAVFLWGFLIVREIAELISRQWGYDASPMLIWLLLPIAMWPIVRGLPGREAKMGLGWHANGKGAAGVGKEIVCGVIGYLAGLPIFLLGVMITILLIALTGAHAEHPITQDVDTSFWGYLLLILMASVWAPLVEETMFRGALFTHARMWLPSVASAALTGLLFAAIHPQGWAAIPALMSLGIMFALIREWRGSLIGSITAHAMHNGFLVTMLTLAVG